jgi:putative selenium metabolism hydrolase
MDFEKIKTAARTYAGDMTKFLRDLIGIPGESCGEEAVIKRIVQEMEALDFDRVEVDKMGNVLGFMGAGETLIAFDAHVDTVGIGERGNWKFDPYQGYENDAEIGGRGASDQTGGMAAAVYGARIMKDLGLLSGKYRVLVSGTVRRKTVTAFAGSTSSMKIRSDRTLW